MRSRGFSCFAQIDVEGYIDVPVNMLRIRALIERDVGGICHCHKTPLIFIDGYRDTVSS